MRVSTSKGQEWAAKRPRAPTPGARWLRQVTHSDFRRAEIGWPLPQGVDDGELEKLLFVRREEQRRGRPLPDWSHIHTELRRKHVTLMLLWQEYKAEHIDGYQYSQFCELYRAWRGKLSVWMRQVHRGGEKLFVDYSGDGIEWIDPKTGEVHEAQLFVAVFGASNFTYAEVTHRQQLRDWVSAQVNALKYFEGVPEVVVPDPAVNRICRYDPETNPTYAEFARHYQTCILPARPRKPRDKEYASYCTYSLLCVAGFLAAARFGRHFHLYFCGRSSPRGS